jgi:Raf kinase inhibitor-like YbhB/YbcL family protein
MRPLTLIALGVATALTACGGGQKASGPLPSAPAKIKLTSSAFADGGAIPKQFTCDGANVSPPLEWSGVPHGAASLELIVEDPDAPGGTFVHWTLYDIDTGIKSLSAGQKPPARAEEGKNSFGDVGYGGPCPPKGASPHHYVFALYALPEATGLDRGASPSDVLHAINRRAVARGELSGSYGR